MKRKRTAKNVVMVPRDLLERIHKHWCRYALAKNDTPTQTHKEWDQEMHDAAALDNLLSDAARRIGGER